MRDRKGKGGKPQLTYESHYQDSQEDPQSITENVHGDNRDQSYNKTALTLPHLALLPTQDLEIWGFLDYGTHIFRL